jgi:hypothetical protein
LVAIEPGAGLTEEITAISLEATSPSCLILIDDESHGRRGCHTIADLAAIEER